MPMTKHLTTARTLGVAIIAALSLGACATRDDITQINTRLDSIDARVQSAAQSAEAANQNSQRANQRLDQIESRVQALETQPGRRPRG
jgi:murein lipoprotein